MLINLRRRFAAGIAAGTAAVLALSACGGGSSTSSDPKKLEVFSYLTSGSEADALKAMIDVFVAKNPGYTVENGAVSGGGGSNAAQVLQSRIAGNDAPTIWQAHPAANLASYAASGQLKDLTSLFESEGWTDKYPKDVLDSLKVNGKIYGVPFGINQMNVVWWNKNVAAKLGVTVGTDLTWDAMVAGIQKAKSAGTTPVCLGDKDPFTTGEIVESAIISHVGADGWRDLTAGRIKWTDPRIAAALADYKLLLDNANKDHTALTWDQSAKRFADGDCLFLPLVDSAYGEFLKAGKVDGKDFDFVYYPGTAGIILNVADLWVESAKASNDEAATAWLKVAGSTDAQLAYQKIKGQIPPRLDADASSLGRYQQTFAKNYKTAQILQSLTFGQSNPPAVQQAFYDAITQFNTSGDVGQFTSAMDTAAANG
jgi:glucose/mannose transport system substrate-binding protein